MLYNYGIMFLYKSFFVNYILLFSLVGLWTIRLLVQVHRHWVQFTLARRGYDNHNCYNEPQIGNGTGAWMTSCPEMMGWEFGYFEKHVSWRQNAELRASSRQRALGPQWPTVEQPSQDEKEMLLWSKEFWVKITVCPRLQLISHTQQTSPFRE